MSKKLFKMVAAGMVLAFACIIMVSLKDVTEIRAEESAEEYIINTMLDMSDGFELLNKSSGRMLSLQHGENAKYQKNGSKFDTYPADGTITERFDLIKSDKGLQFKNYCTSDKMLDVITGGTGIPKAGHKIAIYKPTGDDCGYWRINYCGSDDKGVYINIESVKTPGLYIGHPTSDKNGKKREYMILSTDGDKAWCQWYVCYADKKHTKLTAKQEEPEGEGKKDSEVKIVSNGVERKIKELQEQWDGKCFTVDGEKCSHNKSDGWCYNCSLKGMFKKLGIKYNTAGFLDGYTCVAFQRYVFWMIYGTWEKTNAETPVIGDIIKFQDKNNKTKHDAIYLWEDDEYYYVLDSNIVKAYTVCAENKIKKTKYDHCVFQHAVNYDSINES